MNFRMGRNRILLDGWNRIAYHVWIQHLDKQYKYDDNINLLGVIVNNIKNAFYCCCVCNWNCWFIFGRISGQLDVVGMNSPQE